MSRILSGLVGIGIAVIAIMVCIFAKSAWLKFQAWRERDCKIKWLHKPHKYELEWMWFHDGRAQLRCKKCGKTKKLYITTDSIENLFGARKQETLGWNRKEDNQES